MTDRERLVELLNNHCAVGYEGNECTNPFTDDCGECLADYILADGWIRPPCKVGDVEYVIYRKEIVLAKVRLIRPFISKDETVFKGNVSCMIYIFTEDIKEPHELFVVLEKPYGIERIAYLAREEADMALRKDEGK